MVEDEPPLRRHSLADGDTFVLHQLQRVDRLPRCRRNDRRDDVRDLLPWARHVADVRERQRCEPPIEGRDHGAGAERDRREVVVIEHGSFRETGRAAGPHDRNGVGRQGGRQGRRVQPFSPGERRPRHQVAHVARDVHIVGRDEHAWRGRGDDVLDLPWTEAGVDAGRDRAQTHGCLVTDRIVDGRRQQERDDVAGAHTGLGKRRRDAIGGAIPLRERHAAFAFDVRLVCRILLGDRAQQLHGGARAHHASLTLSVLGAAPCRSRCAASCRPW